MKLIIRKWFYKSNIYTNHRKRTESFSKHLMKSKESLVEWEITENAEIHLQDIHKFEKVHCFTHVRWR